MERIHFRFWGNVFFSNIRCTVWLTICRKKHMISSDRTCAINKSSCVSIWHWHLLNQTKFQKILWRRLIVVLIEIFYQIRNTFYISWTVTFSTFFEHWFRLTKMSCIYPDSLYSHSLNCLYILCIHWKNFFLKFNPYYLNNDNGIVDKTSWAWSSLFSFLYLQSILEIDK